MAKCWCLKSYCERSPILFSSLSATFKARPINSLAHWISWVEWPAPSNTSHLICFHVCLSNTSHLICCHAFSKIISPHQCPISGNSQKLGIFDIPTITLAFPQYSSYLLLLLATLSLPGPLPGHHGLLHVIIALTLLFLVCLYSCSFFSVEGDLSTSLC